MTGLENLDSKLKAQYAGAYGPFVSGDFAIGQELRGPGVQGEVIWSFRKMGQGMVTYVVDDNSAWPVEVKANEVQA